MKILRVYGIPPNLLRAIEARYTNTRAVIVTPHGETQEFDISAGVLEGDTLAPYLFIIVLDYALRKATEGMEEELGFTITPKRSRKAPAVTLMDFDFADDICLLSTEMDQAQHLLARIETECEKVRLELNTKKTEVMTINTPAHEPLTIIKGDDLAEVSNFKYLGSYEIRNGPLGCRILLPVPILTSVILRTSETFLCIISRDRMGVRDNSARTCPRDTATLPRLGRSSEHTPVE